MAVTVQTVWSTCLERISSLVPKYSYNTWIRPLRAISIEENNGQVLNLEVPNTFHQKWIEENYSDIVGNSLREILGPKAALHLSVSLNANSLQEYATGLAPSTSKRPTRTSLQPDVKPAPPRSAGRRSGKTQGFTTQHQQQSPKNGPRKKQIDTSSAPTLCLQLNKNYTFDELVEGDGNRLAYSAAREIATSPGTTSFNPLFVYGNSGLGKTHLAQSICHYAVKNSTAKNPMYVTTADFTNQFINSIRANRCHEFTAFYRQADLLVIDDIQFLTGKERTQEEFFHLFNAIHQTGGQIVLCADRAPGDIVGIHNRLISRFQWGLTVDVTPPDLTTRIAILKKKANRYNINLNGEIAELIAGSAQRNIRELESILTKIIAYSSLHNTPISYHLASQVLQQCGASSSLQVTIDEIISIVSETFGPRPEYIVGKSRKREIVLARHAAMYLAKEFTHHSLKSIGLHFAGRDHSTVIHALKAVEARIETEPIFNDRLEHAKHQVEAKAKILHAN